MSTSLAYQPNIGFVSGVEVFEDYSDVQVGVLGLDDSFKTTQPQKSAHTATQATHFVVFYYFMILKESESKAYSRVHGLYAP